MRRMLEEKETVRHRSVKKFSIETHRHISNLNLLLLAELLTQFISKHNQLLCVQCRKSLEITDGIHEISDEFRLIWSSLCDDVLQALLQL